MTNDRKLALSIAAALLIAFAAIAVLSVMSRPDAPDSAVVAAVATRAPRAVEPVVWTPTAAHVATDVSPVSAGTPEEAVEFQVEPGVNYLARGIEAYKERNFEHAIAYLLAETDTRPDRPYSQYLLGLSLWKGGRLDEAVDAMEQAATLDETAIKTFVNLSRIQNDRGDFEAALDAAWQALDLIRETQAALATNVHIGTALLALAGRLGRLGQGKALAPTFWPAPRRL